MRPLVRHDRTRSLPAQRAAEGVRDGRPAALRLSGVCKQFGDHVVVDNVELEVPRGRVVGLAGPGGAGKTTLLSMATGLLPADEGEVRILGIDACEDRREVKPLIGVVPDAPSIPEHATGRESLICTGMLRGLNGAMVAARADEVLATVDLSEFMTTPVSEYTPGMRKRLCLAAALLHDPGLLVLDEPFEGVDAESASVISTVVRSFAAGGGAVLLSSRAPALAEELCDRVAVIVDGRLSVSAPVRRTAADLAVTGA